jgi:hypothetical protein
MNIRRSVTRWRETLFCLDPGSCFFEAVLAMKHFQNFYVCIGEGDDKLHVAEKHNDYNDHKETAPR